MTAYFRRPIAASHSFACRFSSSLACSWSRPRPLQQSAQYEGEFLQRRDHDLRAVDQRRGQLLRVLVDRLHHTLCVLDLIDRILKLCIEHAPVGDDDHAVEDLLVARVVEARQPMREPRDAVGLAAARGMLDEVVAAGAFLSRRGHDSSHCVELMVAREDQRFLDDAPLRALAIVHFIFVLFHEHEMTEDVEEAVAL